MVTIEYAFDEVPPYPCIDLQVSPTFIDHYKPTTGQIDTGATKTIIATDLLTSLELNPISSTPVRGFSGKSIECDVYCVNIKINNRTYEDVEVIASPEPELYTLIGRDLINLWRMTLNGQSRTGQVFALSTNVNDA